MIEVLGEETLKNGEVMTVKHSDTLEMNPAFPFFLHRIADLMEAGHSAKMTFWDPEEAGMIWGEIDGKVAGIFSYKTNEVKTGLLYVLLTAVHPDQRQKGIHTILNKYFEEHARKLGCSFTVATVHPTNTVRLLTAEKDGMKVQYHLLYKRV